MTAEEMREHARGTSPGSEMRFVRVALWMACAEICERLDALLAQREAKKGVGYYGENPDDKPGQGV